MGGPNGEGALQAGTTYAVRFALERLATVLGAQGAVVSALPSPSSTPDARMGREGGVVYERPLVIILPILAALWVSGCAGGEHSDEPFHCYGEYEIVSAADLATVVPCTTLDGGIWLQQQSWLETFSLPSLERVDGPLLIDRNENLLRVDMPALQRVRGSMSLGSNPRLVDLSSPALESVGDSEPYDWYNPEGTSAFLIEGNTTLSDLEGLSGLESVNGSLVIQGNPALTDLSGLDGLQYVTIGMDVSSNTSLNTFDGVSNLHSIYGTLAIYDNDELSDLNGLNALTELHYLSVQENDSLTRVGLPDLSIVEGILLKENDSLESLHGFDRLPSELSAVYINENDSLSTLEGLSNLTALYTLSVMNNDSLTSFSGMELLTTIEGELEIVGNRALVQLQQLELVSTVRGDIIIQQNRSLETLEGLHNIALVSDDLSIIDNDSLALLDGLIGVSTVGGDLFVQQNKCLYPTDAEEFAAAVVVGGVTIVEDNGANYPCE